MSVSYLALVEHGYGTGRVEARHRFFTAPRAKVDSPKARADADEWVANELRMEGTNNVRCTVSRVEFCIIG